MTKDEIFAKIQDVLESEFEVEKSDVTMESKLFEDLDLDSIDAVDLVVKMKQYISGSIDPEMFKSAKTVGDVVAILEPLAK
ncbi:MAG: acyl carrier protein [Treponema sp.]|nr:acyl carrier protein [Treponema sp.]